MREETDIRSGFLNTLYQQVKTFTRKLDGFVPATCFIGIEVKEGIYQPKVRCAAASVSDNPVCVLIFEKAK